MITWWDSAIGKFRSTKNCRDQMPSSTSWSVRIGTHEVKKVAVMLEINLCTGWKRLVTCQVQNHSGRKIPSASLQPHQNCQACEWNTGYGFICDCSGYFHRRTHFLTRAALNYWLQKMTRNVAFCTCCGIYPGWISLTTAASSISSLFLLPN